jgi:hypothetical protein
MKHLKNFNENLSPQQANSLELALMKSKLSPQVDKLPINRVYSVLFIELSESISSWENPGEMGKYMMINIDYSCYTSVHETLDDAVEYLTSNEDGNFDYCDNWDIFKGWYSDRLVNVIGYNDINFQEIENILIDYNINVDTIWGVIK